MKANEVLKILKVSRSTLTVYVKDGRIKVRRLPTGRYDYDAESVYAFLNKNIERSTVIYARVSTAKQKADLENQVELLKNFCFQNGWSISAVYKDTAGGISFEKREDFFQMLDEILSGKVKRVVITYKDRLSRTGFGLFYHLFGKFGTEIAVMSETGSSKLDSQEIFEEIVSLLHCYSMKLYSSRRRKTVEMLCSPENGE